MRYPFNYKYIYKFTYILNVEIRDKTRFFWEKILMPENFWKILNHFESNPLIFRKYFGGFTMTNKKYKLQTHVDEETKQKLDNFCAKTGESLSSILRRALLKILEEEYK